MDILAIRISKLIKENKITRYKLAKDLKCSKQSVINWCEGIGEPKPTQLRDLAVYFDVTSDYLLGLEDESGGKVTIKNNIHNSTITNSGNGNINF